MYLLRHLFWVSITLQAVNSIPNSGLAEAHDSGKGIPLAAADAENEVLLPEPPSPARSVLHSRHMLISSRGQCMTVSDRNATLLESISMRTREPVAVASLSFDRSGEPQQLAYCAADIASASRLAKREQEGLSFSARMSTRAQKRSRVASRRKQQKSGECAGADSQCVTLYEWKEAKVYRLSSAPTRSTARDVEPRSDVITHGGSTPPLYKGGGPEGDLPSTMLDQVLVPIGCTCMLNSQKSGLARKAIILL